MTQKWTRSVMRLRNYSHEKMRDCDITAAQLNMCSTALVLRQDIGVRWVWIAGDERVMSSRSWIYNFRFSHLFKGDNWHDKYFLIWKALMLAFSRTPLKQNLSNLACHNLAWGLCCRSRFDDLDFVSKSQVCQKYKVQNAYLGFSSVVV